jgi:DNA repair exonuclease SbcCD ATPase subunit
MEITLKKLTVSHMFSYGANTVLDLNKNRITQLTAVNGTGKSTIALIIQELLYSKNIKGVKKADILHRYSGAKEWSGMLEFSVDDKDYKISVRRVGATSKVSLTENNIDISEHKVPDTYKKIAAIIGMNFEVFSQITYQSSVDSLDFIKATDTNRKKFLIKLFGLEKYIDIGDSLKVKLSVIEKELATKNGELNGVNSFLEGTDIKEKRFVIEVPEVDNTLHGKIESYLAKVADFKDQCKRIDKNNILIEELKSLKFDFGKISPELDSAVTERIKASENELHSGKIRIAEINKNLKAINTADTCYVCKQPIDNSTSIKMAEELQSELDTLKALHIAINTTLEDDYIIVENNNKELKEYQVNQKAIDRFEQLSQLIDKDMPTEYPNHGELSSDLLNTKRELNDQERARNEAIQFNEDVKIFNTKVEALQEQKRQFLARQELLNDDIISLNQKIKNLTILRKAFSTTGIVAFKLENLTKELEDTINKYLSELSDGQFQVIFRLTNDKLNIIVVNEGVESPIETASGGEFSRIQTSILLSIRSLLSKMGGNYINLLFLDEITGVLDDAGKEKLIEILQEEMNLNVFLISHDFTHPLIDRIAIIKENKVSRIE